MFSLFGRKDKSEPRRGRDGLPPRIPDSTLRGPVTVESQRELARRTAEKIDQIESEMIAAVPATRSAPATQPMPSHRPLVPPPAQRGAAAQTAMRPPAPALPPLEFGTSIVLGNAHGGGIEVTQSSLPAELEEAAILFANGQPQPAAATLKAAIARGGLDAHAQQAWRMLFDVLQATGAKAEFEAVAIDYAARFEKSPPPWQGGVAEAAPNRRPGTGGAVVAFPGRIDGSAQKQIDQLARALAAKRSVTADFGVAASVEPVTAQAVAQALGAFERGGLELVVSGAQRLFDAARCAIEPGRRDEHDGCWQLALLALRLLGEKQAFDDLAIDFCVTYEVSPPSWEPLPPCIRTGKAPAPAAVVAGEATDPPADGGGFALRGEIVGRMAAELATLRVHADGRNDVVVDCRALQRLDFVAAGELLNEVVAQCAAGRQVLFAEPSAIVEALLVVMGIHELAEIRRRRI